MNQSEGGRKYAHLFSICKNPIASIVRTCYNALIESKLLSIAQNQEVVLCGIRAGTRWIRSSGQ